MLSTKSKSNYILCVKQVSRCLLSALCIFREQTGCMGTDMVGERVYENRKDDGFLAIL